ncbi:MAG: hypothetical protein ACRC34_04790, partial [Cetobacterium sp.]
VMSSELISKIKIATIDLGDSLDEKYYIIFLEGYHLKTSVAQKSYYEETSISLHGIKLYLEDNKFLFPFYAIEKEEAEIEKEEYYNLIFGNIKNKDIDIESLKNEKNLIVILDSSKDIFKTKEMIFIREKDLRENVIEVYNESFINASEELEVSKNRYLTTLDSNKKIIETLEKDIESVMEESLKVSSNRLTCLSEEWKKTKEYLEILKKNIKDKKTDKIQKLENLFNGLNTVDDATKIKDVFNNIYEKIVSEGVDVLNKKYQFLTHEKEIYNIWKDNWKQLEKNLEIAKNNYSIEGSNSNKIYDQNKLEIEKIIKSSDEAIKKFNNTIIELNKKYEEIISKYE